MITGPYFWNALGLGTTQLFAVTLVYNHERTGIIRLQGHRYWFRRVCFPSPPLEWFIIDLLHNEHHMGEDTSQLDTHLIHALRQGRFNSEKLREMAETYAHPATRTRVFRAIQTAQRPT